MKFLIKISISLKQVIFLQEFYVRHDMIVSDRIIEIPDAKQVSGTTT